MSCNLDILHVGIWVFYSGCSLLCASVITYSALDPMEKEVLLKERNEVRAAVTQTSYSSGPSEARSPPSKKMNFLV
jgi:hypothetical protein